MDWPLRGLQPVCQNECQCAFNEIEIDSVTLSRHPDRVQDARYICLFTAWPLARRCDSQSLPRFAPALPVSTLGSAHGRRLGLKLACACSYIGCLHSLKFVITLHFATMSSGRKGLFVGKPWPPARCQRVCAAQPPEISKTLPVTSSFAELDK